MVRHGVGVRIRERFEIKRIDEDRFGQDALQVVCLSRFSPCGNTREVLGAPGSRITLDAKARLLA
ncbi:MAG: hypothetical protein OXH76_00600 [Boseongicola sp.]|nr:hypothetical protein [Boseongicola sp.]MDE0694317.1 hypothetical protein [Boseongicola sp.]MYG75003.1 hypothetical protein [Acidobacteriota bacterium]MYH57841.1 hypothetical protein [Boseongicola sp. SB0675_bin_26]